QRALPTIQLLARKQAKIVIIAHLGRPQAPDLKKSLLPVAVHLAEMLQYKFLELENDVVRLPHYAMPHVFFIPEDFRTPRVKKLLSELNPRDVAVLENLRFYPEENQGEVKFARALANLADIYVNDAFASSYDKRASVYLLPRLLPHYAGLELEQEISVLSRILARPARPYVALVGGIKLSDKFSGLSGLLEKVDYACVGGGLASLFFLAQGYEVGKSALDSEGKSQAADLLRNYQDKIVLPVDLVVARSLQEPETLRVTLPEKVRRHEMILDIGPSTIKKFSTYLRKAKTIIWSGPLGMFEVREFSHGTKALGMLVAARSQGPAFGVAGGGNTLEAIKLIKMGSYFDFLSNGGSSMLQFLTGQKLPALKVLSEAPSKNALEPFS
ncbi:MAG: phosphoglycerate kinase, partial [Candidatus Doudnabacteria bacterium]|nr:phosphoglycerate kinase [Candidatus Doudnabacteria bacterium]